MKHNLTWGLCALALTVETALVTGCSGINASKSISPLDFLLPGLHMQNGPPSLVIPLEPNPAPVLAQAGSVPL